MTTAIKENADNIGMGDLLRPEIKLVQNTGGMPPRLPAPSQASSTIP
jgi:hypothetical protein